VNLFYVSRGLPGGFEGVAWGLAGGSEGPGPTNPLDTPSIPPGKSLHSTNGWRSEEESAPVG